MARRGVLEAPPSTASAPWAAGRVSLRFEDVSQDGRLALEVLPTALGTTLWRGVLAKDPGARACSANGVIPILTRLVLEGTPGPFSSAAAVEAEGTFRIAPSEDGRVMLDMWADLYAPIARAYGHVPNEGQRALAGRVMAEHAFTRLFAPPGQRRVTSFDFEGAPVLGPTRPASPSPEAIGSVPEEATPIEAERRLDPWPVTFGVVHTDGNMHVNSLVYVRLFEEAALRRFVAIGRGSSWLARSIDVAYRKPCFAGQNMRVVGQAFEEEGRLGFSAALVDAAELRELDLAGGAVGADALARARPHAFARLTFEA